MPLDPTVPAVTPATPRPTAQVKTLTTKSLPTKSLNETDFGALVTEDLKAGLRPGPKMTLSADDGFKSLSKPQKFMPLRPTFGGAPPLSAASAEALGAATKHPLGRQKR